MYTTIEEAEEALQIDYVVHMSEFTNEGFAGHSRPTREDISACANAVRGLLSPMFETVNINNWRYGQRIYFPNCNDDKENIMASTMLSVQTVGK